MNSKIVLGIAIGLITGLVLGVFIGVLFISPSGILSSNAGVASIGTVTLNNFNTHNIIYFANLN